MCTRIDSEIGSAIYCDATKQRNYFFISAIFVQQLGYFHSFGLVDDKKRKKKKLNALQS